MHRVTGPQGMGFARRVNPIGTVDHPHPARLRANALGTGARNGGAAPFVIHPVPATHEQQKSANRGDFCQMSQHVPFLPGQAA